MMIQKNRGRKRERLSCTGEHPKMLDWAPPQPGAVPLRRSRPGGRNRQSSSWEFWARLRLRLAAERESPATPVRLQPTLGPEIAEIRWLRLAGASPDPSPRDRPLAMPPCLLPRPSFSNKGNPLPPPFSPYLKNHLFVKLRCHPSPPCHQPQHDGKWRRGNRRHPGVSFCGSRVSRRLQFPACLADHALFSGPCIGWACGQEG